MKKFKKLATLLLSLSFLGTLGFAMVACEKDPETSTPTESSSSQETESSSEDSSDDSSDGGDSSGDEVVQPTLHTTVENVNDPSHVWTTWEAIQEPSCLVNGIKQRVCQDDPSHIHQDYIKARGHDYSYNNGFCVCGDGPIFPDDDKNINWINPGDPNSGVEGAGTEYNRYELTEGYLEVECQGYNNEGKPYPVWLSFSTLEPGQYALYSIDGSRGTQLKRYDASAHYIPTSKDGVFGTGNDFDYYIGFEATMLDDGNHYSVINCPSDVWSTSWRATYSVVGEKGESVYLRFVKIDTPAWRPGYVKDKVVAQQINGKAPEGEAGTEAALVPYDTDYFYDETTGYYRMGTKENPGATIFAAITATAPRMLTDKAFTQIQYEGDNLSLPFGKTADGDYLLKDYCPFIMNDGSYGGTYNSYQTFVNSDGMYPVNQELFTFLNLYVDKNKPMDIPEDIWTNKRENAWLAACYYYANLTPGSAEYPIEASVGTNAGTTIEWDYIYYTLKGGAQGEQAYYVLSWTNENIKIFADKEYNTPGSFVFEANPAKGFVFKVAAITGEAIDFEFTISEGFEGSMDTPKELTFGESVQLSTVAIVTPDSVSHECRYSWIADVDGTILITTTEDFYIDVAGVTTSNAGTIKVDVVAGDEIILFLGYSKEPLNVTVSIIFTPAE